MKRPFVSFLATDDFLPGLAVLQTSLIRFNPGIAFVVLIGPSVSQAVIETLLRENFCLKPVEGISNPHICDRDAHGFVYVYSKLNIFGLTEYDKVVYLDSDMLV